MAANQGKNLLKELKGLGRDLADALNGMRKSREFQHLEKDVVSGLKSITSSLNTAVKAARKSPTTAKLKRRVGRVVRMGASEGRREVTAAQQKAANAIRKARKALRQAKKTG